jgi:hypothetical protein
MIRYGEANKFGIRALYCRHYARAIVFVSTIIVL